MGGSWIECSTETVHRGNSETKAVAAGIAEVVEVHQEGSRGRPAIVLRATEQTEQLDERAWWLNPWLPSGPVSSVSSVSSVHPTEFSQGA